MNTSHSYLRGASCGATLFAAVAVVAMLIACALAFLAPKAYAADDALAAGQITQVQTQGRDAGSYDYSMEHAYCIRFAKNDKAATGAMDYQFLWSGTPDKLATCKYKLAGKAFAGWNTKKDGSGTMYKGGQKVKDLTKGGKMKTLYAMWKPANYVIFKANGGTGSMAKQALPTGVATKLRANKFKRAGFIFTGWNPQKTGKGKSYSDAQFVKKLAKAGKTTTLYARWTSMARVIFKANGGKGTMATQKLKVGKSAKLSANKFKRAGYFFKGWNTKKNGKGTSYANKKQVKAPLAGGAKTVLYAQWGKLPTKVKFSTYSQTDEISNKTYYETSTQSTTRNLKGVGQAVIRFTYNGDKDAYKYVKFSFKDVTPTAYKNMYSDMGVKYSAPKKVKVREPERTYSDYMENTDLSHTAELVVECGLSTRVFKVTASASGNKMTSGYIFIGSGASTEKALCADEKLYRDVVHRVEKKLWKPGMTNLQKISALANYINMTCHYPFSEATEATNKLFWKDWSVEGKTLYYTRYDDLLNMTMRYQGGICHCWVVGEISDIVQRDLGLPYLYNREKDEVAKGEGVWLGIGEYSSTGMPGNHESLIYKDANEEVSYIDAQGGSHGDCAAAHCRDGIVSLK